MLQSTDVFVILLITLGGIFGFVGFILGLMAVIDVKALQKSTHSVQYMPIDPQIDQENQAFSEGWGTSPETIAEQEKLYQEDLKETMPSFVPDEDDKKTYSF